MSDQPPIDRKQQILGALHQHLDARNRRARVTRIAATASAASLLAIAAYVAWSSTPEPTRGPRTAVRSTPDAPPPVTVPEFAVAHRAEPPRVTIRIAATEPLPTTPCDAGRSSTICILSDDQLLAALAEAGRPSGLVRTGGETYIVPLNATPPVN